MDTLNVDNNKGSAIYFWWHIACGKQWVMDQTQLCL